MPGVKCVTGALFSLGKTAHPSVLAQFVKSFLPPGQELVGVGLMANVPDNLIFRQVKDQMHRHRKLHDSQIRRKMSSALADFLNQKLPDLLCKLLKFFRLQGFDIVFLPYPL